MGPGPGIERASRFLRFAYPLQSRCHQRRRRLRSLSLESPQTNWSTGTRGGCADLTQTWSSSFRRGPLAVIADLPAPSSRAHRCRSARQTW